MLFQHEHVDVRNLALTAVGICCLLNGELAKQHLTIFLLQFSNDDENIDVLLTSLKAMIDLLLCFGLEHFDTSQNVENDEDKRNQESNMQDGQSGTNITKFLFRLLDSTVRLTQININFD